MHYSCSHEAHLSTILLKMRPCLKLLFHHTNQAITTFMMTMRFRLTGEERDTTVKQQNPTANSFYRVTSLYKVNVSESGLTTLPKSGQIPREKDISVLTFAS